MKIIQWSKIKNYLKNSVDQFDFWMAHIYIERIIEKDVYQKGFMLIQE